MHRHSAFQWNCSDKLQEVYREEGESASLPEQEEFPLCR